MGSIEVGQSEWKNEDWIVFGCLVVNSFGGLIRNIDGYLIALGSGSALRLFAMSILFLILLGVIEICELILFCGYGEDDEEQLCSMMKC